jgi:hypothetical protein
MSAVEISSDSFRILNLVLIQYVAIGSEIGAGVDCPTYW